METRITKLFNIQYPIVSGGMVWCSGWKLASAVSNAGGLGLIGAGSMHPELLREHIRRCKGATASPFGVNVPLGYPQLEELWRIVEEEKVPVVFTSAGNPMLYTEKLKKAGLTVVHVVSSLKQALKAEAAGVDAIVAEGFEAGGHNGKEGTTTMVLLEMLSGRLSVPVIAAGGIVSGRGVCAALILGAEGVQMGSRFAVSEESSAHEHYKQAVLNVNDGGTAMCLTRTANIRMIRNTICERLLEAERQGVSQEILTKLAGSKRAKLGIFEGDTEEGFLEIGECAVCISEIENVKMIMERIVSEIRQVGKIWDDVFLLSEEK